MPPQTCNPSGVRQESCNNCLCSGQRLLHSYQGPPNTILGHVAIYVVGPSSSGKTTLCNAFAADTGIPSSVYIKEIARNVMRTQGFTRDDVGTFEMQAAIMNAQLEAEAKVLRGSGPQKDDCTVLLLSDRCAVDPMVYAASSGIKGASEMATKLRSEPRFEAVLPCYRKSLFVLLNPVPEWIEDDGVRYCNYLRAILGELAIPFREIGEDVKDIGARVRLVKQWVNMHALGEGKPVDAMEDEET